jgi:hypothetical protein
MQRCYFNLFSFYKRGRGATPNVCLQINGEAGARITGSFIEEGVTEGYPEEFHHCWVPEIRQECSAFYPKVPFRRSRLWSGTGGSVFMRAGIDIEEAASMASLRGAFCDLS